MTIKFQGWKIIKPSYVLLSKLKEKPQQYFVVLFCRRRFDDVILQRVDTPPFYLFKPLVMLNFIAPYFHNAITVTDFTSLKTSSLACPNDGHKKNPWNT